MPQNPVILYTIGIISMLNRNKQVESQINDLILLHRDPNQLTFNWEIDEQQQKPNKDHEWLARPTQIVKGDKLQTADEFYAFMLTYFENDKAKKTIAQFQIPTKLKKRFYVFTNKELAKQQQQELVQRQEQSFLTTIPTKVRPYVPKFQVVIVDLQAVLAEVGRQKVMPQLIRDPELIRRFYQNEAKFKDDE